MPLINCFHAVNCFRDFILWACVRVHGSQYKTSKSNEGLTLHMF